MGAGKTEAGCCDCSSSVRVKTGLIWQKYWWRLRCMGSLDKFGIRILPATLEIIPGVGHGLEVLLTGLVDWRRVAQGHEGSRVEGHLGVGAQRIPQAKWLLKALEHGGPRHGGRFAE